MKNSYVFLLFCVFCFKSYGQKKTKSFFSPNKIGFLYNTANENNFLFDDKDYYYQTSVYKIQSFYKIASWKIVDFELIIQPQYQHIKHQLLNEQFVTPEDDNFQEKREKYTALKTLNLYAIEFGLSIKIKLLNRFSFDTTIGLGFSYIDETTERLAEGFTFIENGSIGFTYQTSKKTNLYVGGNVGHVSNFDFQQPNSGYNIVGFEIGFQYLLN